VPNGPSILSSMSPRLVPVLVLALAAGHAPAPGHAQQAPAVHLEFADPQRGAKLATAFEAIDELFTDFARRGNLPGAAWGIIVDGDLAHSGRYGLRDVRAKDQVRADTVFRIASMTKSFTAMAILKLRDDGKLSLEDPAERYVPELKGLPYPTADSRRITVRDLLSHAPGFPEDNAWADRHLHESHEWLSERMREGIPFANAPGVAYEYSNFGFGILGRIVTAASGVPYNDYVQAHILGPLGMASTTLEPDAVPSGRLALGYRWEDEQWKDEPLLPDGAFGAMGGMLTTIPDLARYVGVLLGAFPPRDGAEAGPVRRSSLREMQQIARTRPAVVTRGAAGAVQLNASGYGYGLRVWQTCEYPHLVAHGGGLPGFGTLMQWLPEHGVGIIAFANLTYTGWGTVVNQALDRMAATGGLQPRLSRPAPALLEARDVISRLVVEWDDAAIDRIAADNLFLDRDRARRRADFAAVRAKAGACKPPSGFEHVENALRGEWVLACERGAVRASVTLAPTSPPKVQVVNVRAVNSAAPASRASCPQ
jgi:CubicO group peptidase (beta-lactamase class C family)